MIVVAVADPVPPTENVGAEEIVTLISAAYSPPPFPPVWLLTRDEPLPPAPMHSILSAVPGQSDGSDHGLVEADVRKTTVN